MKSGKYIKIIGLKFDALEGIQVVTDSNVINNKEAGKFAESHSDGHTIFIGIPCEYTYGK